MNYSPFERKFIYVYCLMKIFYRENKKSLLKNMQFIENKRLLRVFLAKKNNFIIGLKQDTCHTQRKWLGNRYY